MTPRMLPVQFRLPDDFSPSRAAETCPFKKVRTSAARWKRGIQRWKNRAATDANPGRRGSTPLRNRHGVTVGKVDGLNLGSEKPAIVNQKFIDEPVEQPVGIAIVPADEQGPIRKPHSPG